MWFCCKLKVKNVILQHLSYSFNTVFLMPQVASCFDKNLSTLTKQFNAHVVFCFNMVLHMPLPLIFSWTKFAIQGTCWLFGKTFFKSNSFNLLLSIFGINGQLLYTSDNIFRRYFSFSAQVPEWRDPTYHPGGWKCSFSLQCEDCDYQSYTIKRT